MEKKKDEILINYEGEPFYNLNTGEWLIDFEPELKKEFMEFLNCSYRNGKAALRVLATKNMTYNAFKAFEKINGSICYGHTMDILDNHKIYYEHPYTVEDLRFLYYRMGQLLTKHTELSPDVAGRIMTVADSYMMFEGIDLIEEIGDIFNYKVEKLEEAWIQRWKHHDTVAFRINRIFKSEKARNFAYRFIVKIHWLDDVVS